MSSIGVIPAAGLGTRLGAELPKILVSVNGKPILDYLLKAIVPSVDKVIIVVSPQVKSSYYHLLKVSPNIIVSTQLSPRGMGDAIFGAYDLWKNFEKLLIVWGDQVLVNAETVSTAMKNLSTERSFCVPLTYVKDPYVEYVINENKILNILEKREGDRTASAGYSDLGVFTFKTNSLLTTWQAYGAVSGLGKKTKEINFLPFLSHLSKIGWNLKILDIADSIQSLGINTSDDISRAEKHLNQRKGQH